eukprot:1883721-Amphidinium_carterae.1
MADQDDGVTKVPILNSWYESWKETSQSFQSEHNVVIALEGQPPRTNRYKSRQLLEASWKGQDRTHFAQYVGQGDGSSLKVRWAFDGSLDDVAPEKLMPVRSVAIYGPKERRLKVQAAIYMSLDWASPGAIAVLLEHARAGRSDDGELSIGAEDLHANYCKVSHWERFKLWSTLPAGTGCLVAHLFKKPRPAGAPATEERAFLLLVGKKSERQLAAETLKLCMLASPKENNLTVPEHLQGACTSMKVPSVALDGIQGKSMSNLAATMEATGTFIFALREHVGAKQSK